MFLSILSPLVRGEWIEMEDDSYALDYQTVSPRERGVD